ncbi:MAG: outer membrane lipid asymmetry maintenance protein MlaD [Sideroxydans sp.]
MQRTILDLWVGAFVVAGIAALVLLAFKAGNISTYNVSDTYRLHAYFTNVGGLKPTASVRSAGVLVGRVASITLDTNRYEAKVTMEIDKRYQFPADTFANILTSGLLGEQYIGLIPGGDDQMLAEGGEFRQTQSAVVLEELIGKFMVNMANQPTGGK